jgi:alanyl-tRNA synthetase
MKGSEIRKSFLDFFKSKGHEIVPSASLVPVDDPTVLFTVAGMAPFKECFLGSEKRSYTRAASAQKCLRISGKHNDFENVGVTARHHTFFEMLGNFSFGDYFKAEAIQYAWEFVTEKLGLSPDRLWVSVFREDDEAAKLWRDLTPIHRDRIVRLDEKDNFWAMGDTGPCGPCSELYYYVGPDDVPQSEEAFRRDDGSYLEIWNLVFMQFNRNADGTMTPLPHPSIDTGSGLERLTSVVQGLPGNYETDLVRGVIGVAEELSGFRYDSGSYGSGDLRSDLRYARNVALRVAGDHSRAAAFLIADGVFPGSDGRGYALRRIIRRAVRHGRVLGLREPFLVHTAGKVVNLLGDQYPELVAAKDTIAEVIKNEEAKFHETLEGGLEVLTREVERLGAGAAFPGETAFLLHDTFGFPLDLTEDALKPFSRTVDVAAFQGAMEAQRTRSREDRRSKGIVFQSKSVDVEPTNFLGYGATTGEGTLRAVQPSTETPEIISIFFDESPFYAESGGQVGDAGTVTIDGHTFDVVDTVKLPSGQFAHLVKSADAALLSSLIGHRARLEVDGARRKAIATHHSATHVLHLGLRSILGTHVKQAGSLVTPERLRFDFNHYAPISEDQLRDLAVFMNEYVRSNYEVTTRVLPIAEARTLGAMALFGEKYGETVRVVEIGPDSLELCGGTHVKRSGDIGSILVVREGAIASGVRRIECVAGGRAVSNALEMQGTLDGLAATLGADQGALQEKLEALLGKEREVLRELGALRVTIGKLTADAVLREPVISPSGVPVFAKVLDDLDAEVAKEVVDIARVKAGSGVIVVAIKGDRGGMLLAGATSDLAGRLHLGSILKETVAAVGGKGGGRPDFAQAGGLDPEKTSDALALFVQRVP